MLLAIPSPARAVQSKEKTDSQGYSDQHSTDCPPSTVLSLACLFDERFGLLVGWFEKLHGCAVRLVTAVQLRPPLTVRTMTFPAAAQQSSEPTQAMPPALGPPDRLPVPLKVTQTRLPSKVGRTRPRTG